MALRTILNHSLEKLKSYRNIQYYYSSSTQNFKNLYKPSLPILSTPWLMLPPDIRDGPNGPTDNFLNIIDKSIIKIDRRTAHGSVPQNTRCVGSAKGWIAFDCDTDNTSFYLVNPYTKSSCRKLPRLYNIGIFRDGLRFTLDDDIISLIDDERDRRFEYDRSSDGHMVAYSRKAKTEYKVKLEEEDEYMMKVEKPGRIRVTWSCRSSKTTTGEFYSFIDLKLIENVDNSWPQDHAVERFVVVAEDDDDEDDDPSLFLVVRHLVKDDYVQCQTTDIKLFEIIEDREVVEGVESIGDKALFLGRNSEPFFVSTRDNNKVGFGLRSNCVYVAEELGFYDLETKCVTPVVSLGDVVHIRPQVYWIAPPPGPLLFD